MFKLINFIVGRHSEFDYYHNFQKRWDRKMSITVLHHIFVTLSKCVGTEDTKCWSIESGILSHSCLMCIFSCSTVFPGFSIMNFELVVHFQWEAGLDSPCCTIHQRFIPVFNAVACEGLQVPGIQCLFPDMTHTYRNFSRFSEFFDIMDYK